MTASPSSAASASSRPCSRISRGLPAKSPLRSPYRAPPPTRWRRAIGSTMPRSSKPPPPRSAAPRPRPKAAPSPTRCLAPSASPRSTCCTASPRACSPGATISATKAGGRPNSAGTSPGAAPTNSGRWWRRDEHGPALRSDPSAPRMRGLAAGGARLPRRGDRQGHLRSASPRSRRLARPRLFQAHRRQGLDRHDLAEKIRRPRTLLSRALRRHRGIPRRQRAGSFTFRRRPPERADPAQIRARAHQDEHPAAHLPRRIVLRHRHERAGFRLRSGRRQGQGDQGRGRLALQRQQDLDQQRPCRRLHDRPVPHLAADQGEPPPRPHPVPDRHEGARHHRQPDLPDDRPARLQRSRVRRRLHAGRPPARRNRRRVEAGDQRARLRAQRAGALPRNLLRHARTDPRARSRTGPAQRRGPRPPHRAASRLAPHVGLRRRHAAGRQGTGGGRLDRQGPRHHLGAEAAASRARADRLPRARDRQPRHARGTARLRHHGRTQAHHPGRHHGNPARHHRPRTGAALMPDIGKMLWPKSVAVVGASSDLHGLRGRILEIMLSHPYAGRIYPVSRSAGEVQGLKAYPSVDALPEPVDLAILIIPAEYIPAELERCGKAGIRAAVILSSGFAEEGGKGAAMQQDIAAIARRYDMAVTGPNTEGFANIEAGLCPTFSPALDKNAGPIRPARALGAGQVSVISQSGGLGFAFFDRARPRNLSFRHIVTTGNEAALEVFDFVDYMLDEGGTDVFLLLLEDVKSPDKFRRVAEKALRLGKPLIVSKIGQSDAGSRAVASHTAALAGSQRAYRAIFERYGLIDTRDLDEMLDVAAGFLACGGKLPAGKRVGICTSSGGAGVWMADACAAAGLDVPVLDDATRRSIDVHIPSYGTSQNPVDSTAQGVHKMGYATFARLVSQSPLIDAVVVVVTARRSAFLEGDLPKLKELKSETNKPVFMWTYTLPSERSVEILNEAGYPLFTGANGCARTLAAMADYRALRERALTQPRAAAPAHGAREQVRGMLDASGEVLSEWQARPLLALYGIGDNAGTLVRSAKEAEKAASAAGALVALKVQSADIPHKTEAGAVALAVAADGAAAAFDTVLANARRFAPKAKIDGVLVQSMAKD